jgi:hypothetical protein
MACQYSTHSLVSRGKHETVTDAGVEERGSDASKVRTATVVVGSYHALTECLEVMSCAAKAAKALRSRTCGRLYVYDALLERLAHGLEDVAAELGQFIQEEHAKVRQRPLPRHRPLAAADHAHIGDGVMGGPEGARRDDDGAPAGEPGDAEVTHASCEGQSVSSRPGRFHPHRQRNQLMKIN